MRVAIVEEKSEKVSFNAAENVTRRRAGSYLSAEAKCQNAAVHTDDLFVSGPVIGEGDLGGS